MHCPSCSTEQVRKFSIVYEEGTTRGTSEGSSDYTSYTTDHYSQSPLAARCSPPNEPEVGIFLGGIGTFVSFGAGIKIGRAASSFWWGVGSFFVMLWALYFVWRLLLAKRAFAKYEVAFQRWQQSWVCMKCGGTFETPK